MFLVVVLYILGCVCRAVVLYVLGCSVVCLGLWWVYILGGGVVYTELWWVHVFGCGVAVLYTCSCSLTRSDCVLLTVSST